MPGAAGYNAGGARSPPFEWASADITSGRARLRRTALQAAGHGCARLRMICPNCGTANPAGAHFCINCGQALPRACPVCGMLNPADAHFCMRCGTRLVPSAQPAAEPSDALARDGAGGVALSHDGTSDMLAEPARELMAVPAGMPPSALPAGTSVVWFPGRSPRGALAGEPAPAGVAPAEERRIVTVLFADLISSTAIAATMDPEELRALLAAYFAAMSRQLHRHGGTIEKYIGDAVMAVFGLPLAHEDDPVRAVRAAVDMRDALRGFNEERRAAESGAPELHMRIGINTGEVVAAGGADGAEGHDFLVTGDAVNVAARLQELAGPDAILVGARTYRSTRGAVVYRALPPVEVRGKPQPIAVWEVLSLAGEGGVPAPRPRGVEGLRAPLVGREMEMELLQMAYTRTVDERTPHLVTVVGIPGIGKTRLVREFISRTLGFSPVEGPNAPGGAEATEVGEAPGAPLVLAGRCPPYGEGITYWPLAEMLRGYCGLAAFETPERAREALLRCVSSVLREAGRTEDPVAIAAYLGHTIGIETPERRQALLPTDAKKLQDGLFRAWRTFFEALAVGRPLIVLVDDIHWADEVLLDLIEYLAARLSGAPVLLLCPARPELLERRPDWGSGRRNDVSIALEPLAEGDTALLVRALLPGEGVPETLRRGILEQADGNPFYVEEIVRMLIDRHILVREPAGESAAGESLSDWRVAPEWVDSPEVSDPDIPDTVQGVLAARLDLLPADERTMLQHAAIIGRYFWLSLLQGLAPEFTRKALQGMLDDLLRRDMIQEGDSGLDIASTGERVYQFKHNLIREVTYSTIPRARRAREHLRVADWLETHLADQGDAVVELLARHYQQYYLQSNLARSRNTARRQAVRAKVVGYLTQAGAAAAGRHANAKAERYYSDAVSLLAEGPAAADLPERVDVLMKRGDVRWLLARGDAAWTDYHEALRLWLEGNALAAPAGSEEHARHQGEAGAQPTKTAQEAPAGRPTLPDDWPLRGLRLYRLLVQLPARHLSRFQDPPPHEELRGYLNAGLDMADRLGLRDTLEGAALLTAKGFFWWSWPERRGEKELLDALRSAREAVSITEYLRDPRGASEALDALGNLQAATTDLRGFLESQTRRLYWARQIDDPGELVDIHAEVCRAFQLIGEYALAVEHARVALELADKVETDPLRMQALDAEILAYFEWDHWPEALQAGERLVSFVANMPVERSYPLRWALLALAIVRERTGAPDVAEQLVHLVPDVSPQQEAQYIGLFRGRLALARGAYKEAERVLVAAMEYRAGRHSLAALIAELSELGARSGDHELYDRFGAQALELGWRSGARKALAQAIRARGLAAIADSRWEDAESDLLNALNRYEQLGAAWEAARTRYALAALAMRRGRDEDRSAARTHLRQALETFEALHAVSDIERARVAMEGGEVLLL